MDVKSSIHTLVLLFFFNLLNSRKSVRKITSSPGFFIEKIKLYELQIRTEILSRIGTGTSSKKRPEVPIYLPFDKLYKFAKSLKADVMNKTYSLRSIVQTEDLINKIEKLSLDLENLLFCTDPVLKVEEEVNNLEYSLNKIN